ncbi:hypothetical protein GTP45_20740 [Pseudoduganella sp. FT55W]|uniref:Uncharacterized protein n=1 Tax=Duganella rivi TaxID=2666083 RepID=A0A7X4KE95_9BURK|nr:hypothetical protein [Duganella rivi]MYM69248.1 hypothetical protein [Duganella rivi]
MKIKFFMQADAGHGKYPSPVMTCIYPDGAAHALEDAIRQISEFWGSDWYKQGVQYAVN